MKGSSKAAYVSSSMLSNLRLKLISTDVINLNKCVDVSRSNLIGIFVLCFWTTREQVLARMTTALLTINSQPMCVFPSGALYIYLQTSVAGFCSCDLRLLSKQQSHLCLITNATSRNYQISFLRRKCKFFQSRETIIDLKTIHNECKLW